MKEGIKAAAPRPWASAARHHSERSGGLISGVILFPRSTARNSNLFCLPVRAPNCGWAARAADIPIEPRPPNSGLPAPAV